MINKRRVIQLIAIVLVACGSVNSYGQTGPAGIGNSNGTNGHPHNLVWLDASDLGGFVTGDSWLDKSGNAHHAVSAGANLSLGDINGVNALDFSAFTSGNFAIAHHTDFDDVDQLSIFVVYNSGPSTNPQGLVSKRASTENISFSLFQYTNYRLYADYNTDGNRIYGANNTSDTDYIGNYIFQNNDTLKIYKNGILDNAAWDLTGSAHTNNTAVNIEIGKLDQGYNNSNNFKGQIAEIIIYKTNLSPIQRALVVSYLSSKYGVGVQEVNLAYSPSDGTYYTDLTGYARSSAGFKSFGPSEGLYISLNDAGIGDYITAAHNGAPNDLASIQTGADVTASGAVAAWNRDWFVEKGGVSTAQISFSFPEAFENGSFPQELSNYVLLRKDSPAGIYSQVSVADKGVELGERVWFEVANADFEDGYFTLGTLDQGASPLEGGSTRTWYTLISGDWDTWEVWTLDPSGALPNNPSQYTPTTSPTAASDKVVILNGKTVTVSTNDKIHQQVTVDGRLDLQGTSGHDFGVIRGRGRILLSDNHFPAGNATHFSSAGQGEGTVVYYGNGFDLTQDLVVYNLEIDLSPASSRVTLLSNLTINGEFRVKNGEFQFNNDAATTALNVTVNGHVVVEENGKVLTGTANARHQFNLYGDFTNNGNVAFTNRISPTYGSEATNGIVDVNFLNGSKNQLAFFNGPSKVYRIEIDKGTDATYELILEATHADHFQLLGYANQGHSETAQLTTNSNALGLLRGTVRVKSNINIPVLNNTGNYNISESARLWVDGGTVAKTSGTAIVPYGIIQVSAGSLSALVNSGITTRGNALVKVEGGTLNMNQLRTSVFGSENVGGYVQSGGVTNVLGGSINNDYYCFNLTYPGNVFNMSGGTLHIEQANSKGGVFIASDPVNQNVTGGTVIVDINNNNDFAITSKAPFWNFIVRKTSGTKKHILAAGVNVGSENINLGAQPLRVLNDLTIESGTWLNANGQDVAIGGDFTLADNAMYEFHNNTTTFNGTSDAELHIGDITGLSNPSYSDPEGIDPYGNWEHPFYNFVINKPADKTLKFTTKGSYDAGNISTVKHSTTGFKNIYDTKSNLVKVVNDFVLESGRLDIDVYSLRLYGDITNKGICGIDAFPLNAQIKTREEGSPVVRVVTTTDNAVFGNLRVNMGEGILQFTSDVHVNRLLYKHGRINIGTHNLKVDKMVLSLASGEVVNNDFSVEDMIIMDGNPSDGGLSLYVPGLNNPGTADPEAGIPSFYSSVYFFPIGTGTTGAYPESRYTPANIRLQEVSDDGYVTVNVVSDQLQTAGPHPLDDDVLNRYFRIRTEGFETLPKVERYRLHVTEADLPDGDNNDEMLSGGTYSPAYVLDGTPYTRKYEINTGANASSGFQVVGDQEIRIFLWGNEGSGNPSGGFDLVNANYTAGASSKFVGQPAVIYNQRGGGWNGRNWGSVNSWYDSPNGTNRPSAVPGPGDIVVIRGVNGETGINVDGTREVAEVIFQREGTYTDIESLPRLRFEPTDQLTAAKISGVGELYLRTNMSSQPIISADIGEFAANDTSLVDFYMTANGTYNVAVEDFFSVLPTLRIYGQNSTSRQVSFNYGLKMKNLIVDGSARLLVGGNYEVEKRTRLGFTGHGRIEFPNGTTPYHFTTGEFVTGKAKNDGGNDYELTVATGGGNGVEHIFEVRENIHLKFNSYGGNMNMDLYTTPADNNVILRFAGEGNHSFINDYTVANSTIDLYKVEMDKGVGVGSSFTFEDNFALYGATNGLTEEKAIQLLNGRLILAHPDVNLNLTTGGEDFFIPQTAALEVQLGRVGASGNSGILLDGQLIVSGGTLDMSGGNNYIQYSASGNATINVSAGSLTVGSQIRRGLTSSEGILNYTQSGGTVIVGNDAAPENHRGVFEVLNAGSNFSFTGGDLQVVRAQNNPAFASIYLAPETVSTNNAAVLRIGNDNTPSNQIIGLYANIEIPNLLISNSGANNPTLRQWTVPLTVSNLLEVEAGAVFDANGNDLILKGDFLSAGDFIPNSNTTFFSGTGDQELTGSLTFFNLTKSSPGQLSLNSSIQVQNTLRHNDGVLADNSHVVSVGGSLFMYGDHLWGGSGRGIVLNGIDQQMLYGSGSFGKLTTNNPEGIKVDDGNTVYINHALQMEQGILNVGSNLLVLTENAIIIDENPFSVSNMIQTNVSFTDNGVKKFLPSGTGNFTFPVGSAGRYTPVKLSITANNNGTGSLLVKPAGEAHPSVTSVSLENLNYVLNYHWVVRAEGLSGFSAEARMKYDVGDVKGNIAEYITARLLSDGTGNWNKFSGAEVIDEVNRELVFSFFSTDDAGISGDYTAGLDAAIPDQVPTYITIAHGFWNDASIWDTHPVGGGSVPESGPRGSMVIVNHDVEVPVNYTSSYRTTIAENGILSIGSTFGHRLGEVFGSGVLSLESGDMPAGFYEAFLTESGGTLRFGGSNSYDILSAIHQLNNLELTGSGTRRFPNIPVQLTGNLLIDGPLVRNEQNKAISVKGDVVFESGSFVAGNGATSVFVLNGLVTQTLSGLAGFSGSNSFNRLTVNNPAGVVFALDADVKDLLTLAAGRLIVNETAQFRVDNFSSAAITGASATRYIDGPLYKRINSGASFDFPLGNETRYGKIVVANVSASGLWRAQYHSSSPNGAGLSTSSKEAPVQYVSSNEYWNIEAPVDGASAEVTLRWDASSGVNPSESGLRGVQWLTNKWHVVTLSNITGTSTSGTAITSPVLNFNANTGGNYITFGAITIPAYTWTGATDTDWFTAGNWTNNTVPSASANTTIGAVTNLPEIAGASVAQVNDLVIENGAILTLNPGGKLTVNGDLTIADVGGLVMENTTAINGLASLMTNGSISGEARIELEFPYDEWYYVSQPIANAQSDIYAILNGDDSFSTSEAWVNVHRANRWYRIGTGVSLAELEGVSNRYRPTDLTNHVVSYTGVLNNGSIARSYTNRQYYLLGNPYPSAINWQSDAGWVRNNVGGTIWYRTRVNEEMAFVTYNRFAEPGARAAIYPDQGAFGDEEMLAYIPPLQSVWMSSLGASSVSIDNEARSHAPTGTFLKSSSGTSNTGNVVRIIAENANSYDGAVLYFSENADEGIDRGDSEKMFNESVAIPEIYTRVGDKAMAINGLPLITESSRTIPLSVRNRQAGEVTLRFDLQYYSGAHAPYLEDRETGAFINLLQEASYSYLVTETGDKHDRFALHFYYVTTDLESPKEGEVDAGSSIKIKSIAGKVLVSVGTELLQDGEGVVEIYTIEGRKISEVPARTTRTLVILPNESGVYIIRAKFGSHVKSEQVIGVMK